MLTRIWYDGAYTVKLNLEANYIGAILVDRGDRIAWTGDDHCAQAAALAAFGNYDFIKENIDSTANNDNGIASYGLYWVLSLIDYYKYTGDAATLGGYITNVESTLDGAYAAFGTNPNLGFYGWDERLGAGFETRTARRRRTPMKCCPSSLGRRSPQPWARMDGRIFRPNTTAMPVRKSPPCAKIPAVSEFRPACVRGRRQHRPLECV